MGRWILLTLPLLFVPLVWSGSADTSEAERLAADLAADLGSTLACPAEIREAMKPDRALHCGKFEGSYAEFKRELRATVQPNEKVGFQEPWSGSGRGVKRRQLSLAGMPAAIAFDTKNAAFVVILATSFARCPDDDPITEYEGRTVYIADDDSPVSRPELIEHVPPDAPAIMRRLDGSVRVALKAVVNEQGLVDRICVLGSRRNVDPYVVEAVEAVRQWRYEPAMLDGKPVPVSFKILVAWETR